MPATGSIKLKKEIRLHLSVQFLDLFNHLFESSVPTPIAKKTIKGTYLYGCKLNEVKAVKRLIVNITPAIKTRIESACLIPFFAVKNNATVRGKLNTKKIPSNLSWYDQVVKLFQKSLC